MKQKLRLPLIFMLLFIFTIPTHAENYTLKHGKWKTIGISGGTAFNYMKVNIPKDGTVTIYTKGSSYLPEVGFYKKKPGKFTGCNYCTNPTRKKFKKNKVYTDTVNLKKGTYYFKCVTMNQKFRIKYNVTKAVTINNNINRQTATPLPEGVKLSEWFSKEKRAGRWYKIDLTQESKIWVEWDQLDCIICDEYGNESYMAQEKSGSAWYYTQDTMKPGVYYIVTEDFDKDEFMPEWKGGIEPYLLFESSIRWSSGGPLK